MHEFILLAVLGLAAVHSNSFWSRWFGDVTKGDRVSGENCLCAACMACAGERAQTTAWIWGERSSLEDAQSLRVLLWAQPHAELSPCWLLVFILLQGCVMMTLTVPCWQQDGTSFLLSRWTTGMLRVPSASSGSSGECRGWCWWSGRAGLSCIPLGCLPPSSYRALTAALSFLAARCSTVRLARLPPLHG